MREWDMKIRTLLMKVNERCNDDRANNEGVCWTYRIFQ